MKREANQAGLSPVPAAGEPVLSALVSVLGDDRFARLPIDIVAKARTCILDAIAGCFAVPGDRRIRATRAVLSPLPPNTPSAMIFGSNERAAPAEAAFANSVASATAETNDTHAPSATHPGIVVVPTVLAIAFAERLSGAAAIAAIVVGYEAMGRLARAIITPDLVRTFRSSGIVGPTAAALAAAHLLRLSPDESASAAALATHTASGLNEWANAGTDEHVFHIGFAARNGVVAALLARAGITAAPSILDGKAGLFAAFGERHRATEVLAGKSDDFEIRHVVYKPAPACFFVQTPAQVAEQLANALGPIADTDKIEIAVSEAAAFFPGCDNKGPMQTRQDASMSLQFSVASVLSAGAIRHANWEGFHDAGVNALAARCGVSVDEALTRAYPRKVGARIAVGHRDGTSHTFAAEDFVSMNEDAVRSRFVSSVAESLGRERAEKALDFVDTLQSRDDISPLGALLSGHGSG